ncbi:MAG: hypothetical protein JNL70_23475 [Saprospiraceae bacterium]|nr:hypothetical protein [Saprospiraceae bacterium]
MLYKISNQFNYVLLGCCMLIGASCTPPMNEYNAAMLFFESAQFKGYYPITLPLHAPDSTMMRIKAEVPKRWQGLACEMSFYTLPNTTADTTYLKFLDAYDRHFKVDSARAFTQMIRGRIFINQLQYDTAAACLQEAYHLSEKAGHMVRMGDVKTYMARLAAQRSQYPEAIRLYMEVHDIFKPLTPHDGGRYMELMLVLGRVYQTINDPVLAAHWHRYAWQEALKDSFRTRGYHIQFAMALAEDHLMMQHLDSARIMIDSSFKLEALYQNHYLKSERYRLLALIQIAEQQCDTALKNLHLAYAINESPDRPKIVSRYLYALGKGYQCKGQLDSALFFYQKALSTPDTARQAMMYKDMAWVYEQKQDRDKALFCERKSSELHRRTFTTEKDMAVGRAQVQRDAEERLQRIEAAHQKARLWYGLSLFTLIGGLVVSGYLLYRYREHRKVLAIEKAYLAQLEAEKTKALTDVQTDLSDKEKRLQETEAILNLKEVFIEELKMQLTLNAPPQYPSQEALEKATKGLATMSILTTDDWMLFRELFDQRFPNYILRLHEQLPQLTTADVRLFLLIKIGFDANEISHILGISYKSVYSSRYRLRQKIGLVADETLEDFIQRF